MSRYIQTCPCGATVKTESYATWAGFNEQHNAEHSLAIAAVKAGHYVQTKPNTESN